MRLRFVFLRDLMRDSRLHIPGTRMSAHGGAGQQVVSAAAGIAGGGRDYRPASTHHTGWWRCERGLPPPFGAHAGENG